MRYITSFLLIFVASTFLQTAVAQATHGPYIKGRTAYRMRLSRCAMWWRRLGDYTKSNGKWLTKNTPLYM
ncbi:hypothetical protein KJ865_11400, partial [Myxococcota bacterium]|nr:hypothetical protein [Myxococcota bacterium]